MRFEKRKTFTSDAIIKDKNGKLLGKLKLTYEYLGVKIATQLVDEKTELFDTVGSGVSSERLSGMTDYLSEKLVNYLKDWNLTDENGKMPIELDTFKEVFESYEFFWAIWEDWSAYLMHLSTGADMKKIMRELERKNYGK